MKIFSPCAEPAAIRYSKINLRILVLLFMPLSLVMAVQRPNILMVVVDDMGFGDMSAQGHPWLKTPNFDRLHGQSVRMIDFMVSPTCAPTRAALMTGAHEFRSGVTHTIHGMERMNPDCTTLAQVLKRAGYATGMFGKWHLGDQGEHAPWERGFDIGVIAENDGAAAQHKPLDPMFLFNGAPRKMKGPQDQLFAKEAMAFMEQDRDEPFFCYYATYDPHKGYWAEERFVQEMERQVEAAKERDVLGVSERRQLFFAEILQVDWILGEIMDFLDEKKLSENTLVLLVTDNGGTDGVDAYNMNMRGHKVTAWVGGTRALAFWRLPGVLEPGDLAESCAHIDVLPTLAEVAGVAQADMPCEQVEGRSAWPLLSGEHHAWPDRYLYAHVARWEPGKRDQHKYEGAMVRHGNYDLVRIHTASMGRGYTDHPEFHRAASPGGEWGLYHRLEDPRQENDLSGKRPDLLRTMSSEFERWWEASEAFLIHE